MSFINSDGVWDIHEFVLQTKFFGQVSTQGLDSVAFGGMVSCREIMNPQFPRQMHRGFGNLTADEGIQTGSSGLFDPALGRTATPADTPDLVGSGGDVLGFSPEGSDNPRDEGRWRLRSVAIGPPDEVIA